MPAPKPPAAPRPTIRHRTGWGKGPTRTKRLAIAGLGVLAGGVVATLVSGAVFGAINSNPATPVSASPTISASVPVAGSSATQGGALDLLETLPVKGRAPKTGYDRVAQFGTAWLDVDRNGCDTRNDILARDLHPAVKSGVCRVTAGTLDDPYTGKTIAFVRGSATSAAVQIDHVVPLLNAWETGAQQLTQAQRVALANDPMNLFAVDGPTNGKKGAGDAATWLPPEKGFRCTYVARQVSVKATYGLWVTRAEHDAIERILASCASEPAITSTLP
ncbi:HNH endonuclease family protein [Leifsonia sp. NPDC058230]|uniref:HNH endonuclease family protein n=1 Tax=Leifsonia sp. NPDC058230 TaxID=3346391 RepID=UPI0036DD04E9